MKLLMFVWYIESNFFMNLEPEPHDTAFEVHRFRTYKHTKYQTVRTN
jgi:hypothetical protein